MNERTENEQADAERDHAEDEESRSLEAAPTCWLSRGGRMMLAVPILATVCVLGYAVTWFAMSGKP